MPLADLRLEWVRECVVLSDCLLSAGRASRSQMLRVVRPMRPNKGFSSDRKPIVAHSKERPREAVAGVWQEVGEFR
jgi:hypothetical protein